MRYEVRSEYRSYSTNDRTLERTGVDLVLRLSENNAPRRCSMCELDAEFYVYTDSVMAIYVCGDYLDEAVKQAQT